MPEISRFTQQMLCRLTHDEVFDLGRQLASQVQVILEEEIHQAHQRKIMKDKMEELEGERNRLADLVESGFEKRDIECVVSADYTTGKAYTMRLDTGEVIGERALKADEQQMGLAITKTDTVAAKMRLRKSDGSVVNEPQAEAPAPQDAENF